MKKLFILLFIALIVAIVSGCEIREAECAGAVKIVDGENTATSSSQWDINGGINVTTGIYVIGTDADVDTTIVYDN